MHHTASQGSFSTTAATTRDAGYYILGLSGGSVLEDESMSTTLTMTMTHDPACRSRQTVKLDGTEQGGLARPANSALSARWSWDHAIHILILVRVQPTLMVQAVAMNDIISCSYA